MARFELAASCSQSQLDGWTATAVAQPTWAASSANVHWCPSLATAMVTHLVTRQVVAANEITSLEDRWGLHPCCPAWIWTWATTNRLTVADRSRPFALMICGPCVARSALAVSRPLVYLASRPLLWTLRAAATPMETTTLTSRAPSIH
jgi:hypothetical protein